MYSLFWKNLPYKRCHYISNKLHLRAYMLELCRYCAHKRERDRGTPHILIFGRSDPIYSAYYCRARERYSRNKLLLLLGNDVV